MPQEDFSRLKEAVAERQKRVQDYLFDEQNAITFSFQPLADAVYSYIRAGGKSLRSAVMMFACGAVGGDENTAIPAAAAIELYHTFTLVHDDIIDRDDMRRGVPTVHRSATQVGHEMGFVGQEAEHFGLAIAILTGDIQQGWAASMMPDLYHRYGVPAELALNLITELFRKTQVTLINGETLDVLQAGTPVDEVTETAVLDMLWQKTGVLYEFAGRAGAAIGLKEPDLQHPTVEALAKFTGKCGLAFQIQDDVLGILGNEEKLGKSVGADIREGKRTVIVLNSLKNMTESQRASFLNTLGNREASNEDVINAIKLLQDSGGVDYAKNFARTQIQEAISLLNDIEESESKELLTIWAEYIIERDL